MNNKKNMIQLFMIFFISSISILYAVNGYLEKAQEFQKIFDIDKYDFPEKAEHLNLLNIEAYYTCIKNNKRTATKEEIDVYFFRFKHELVANSSFTIGNIRDNDFINSETYHPEIQKKKNSKIINTYTLCMKKNI